MAAEAVTLGMRDNISCLIKALQWNIRIGPKWIFPPTSRLDDALIMCKRSKSLIECLSFFVQWIRTSNACHLDTKTICKSKYGRVSSAIGRKKTCAYISASTLAICQSESKDIGTTDNSKHEISSLCQMNVLEWKVQCFHLNYRGRDV